jgi:hypothetical protein
MEPWVAGSNGKTKPIWQKINVSHAENRNYDKQYGQRRQGNKANLGQYNLSLMGGPARTWLIDPATKQMS